ncbi:unnamed protein product [Phytophthora fragariaefolia]|uniref:Unnamed protein product n=1 Tax=Phytophthora fragariaefolia TaxID=1490495 RepID=A0A9W7CWY1_9STRA|nr:unnamed protein product [Phytophthora fragariaefolia]
MTNTHAELFNSLLVSYCMQNSPSFLTALLMTTANIVTTGFSLRDIEYARRGLKLVEERIDKEKRWSSFDGRILYNMSGGRRLTTLERARALLQQDENSPSARLTALPDIIRISSYRDTKINQTQQKKAVPTSFKVIPKKIVSLSRSLRYVGHDQSRATVHPTLSESKPVENDLINVPHTLLFTCKVQRLLYMSEFLILLKYVEVVIPLIFSNNLLTYHLPITQSQLLRHIRWHGPSKAHRDPRKRDVLFLPSIDFANHFSFHAQAYAWTSTVEASCICPGETVPLGADQSHFLGILQCASISPALRYANYSDAQLSRDVVRDYICQATITASSLRGSTQHLDQSKTIKWCQTA